MVDRLSASLDTSIADANKTTVSRALSNLLPIIEVKDNAEVTVAAMKFGLNLFQEDIPKLASGTASDTVFNAYQNNILSYIATDQGVNADELAQISQPLMILLASMKTTRADSMCSTTTLILQLMKLDLL